METKEIFFRMVWVPNALREAYQRDGERILLLGLSSLMESPSYCFRKT